MTDDRQDRLKPREIVLINRSDKGLPGRWEQLERAARVLSLVAIPVVLGVGGWWIQNALSQRSVSKDYVALAVSILSRTEQETDPGLRLWAVDLLNANSPVKFDAETSKKLTEGELTLPVLPTGSFQPTTALPEDDPRKSLSRSIGKLVITKAGREAPFCTAWLVAIDQALTADYCMQIVDGPLTLHLESTSGSKAYSVERAPLELDHALGFALLKVGGSPGKDNGYLSLSATGPREGESLFIAHYAQGEHQSFSKPCQITGIDANGVNFHHDCDTTGGVGGAPLIRLSDRTVVGLHYTGAAVGGVQRGAIRMDTIVAASATLRKSGADDSGR